MSISIPLIDPSTTTSRIIDFVKQTNFTIINYTIFYNDSRFLVENNYDNNSTNDEKLEHAPQLSKSAIIRVIVLTLMAIISLFGNTATMWNIYKTRMSKRSSRRTSGSAIYSLIFHLSIADVLVTGFCIIGEAAWSYTVEWLADDITCKAVKYLQMFSLYLSTYVLVLIGIDRCIAVKYPMKSLNMSKRCHRYLSVAYIVSFILSLPQILIFRVVRGPFVEDFHQCVTHGSYTAHWQEQFYTTFTLFTTFIIPLIILIVSYLLTFMTISGSEKMFQGSKLAVYTQKPLQTNRQRLIHKAKMKSLRISVVIIAAFLICWTPYNVMMIIFMFLNPDKKLGEDLQSGIFFFGMSNSLVNPLIYGAFHLCPPIRRSNSQYKYCLTRENSVQRSPSVMTATTQIDLNGRLTFKRSSYLNRSASIRASHIELNNTTVHKPIFKSPPSAIMMRQISNNGNHTNLQTKKLLINYNQNGIESDHKSKLDISSV